MEEPNKTIGEGILEYNSARERLLLPEYGRNIQKLVQHAQQLEDPEKRQWYVETLIELMNQMLPGTKTSVEIADKLWNHLFYIAGYDLDVKVPENVIIHKKGDVFMIPSEDMEYPQKKIPISSLWLERAYHGTESPGDGTRYQAGMNLPRSLAPT